MCYQYLVFYSSWLHGSRKPSKFLDYIGKFLNPVFLVLLGIVVLLAFIHPMGGVSHAPVSAQYKEGALLKGFIDGYNTLTL